MKKANQIKRLFEASGGVMTARELKDKGVTRYLIKQLMDSGEIETVRRGVYKLSDSDVNEFAEALKIVSKGVFCLYSAAIIHDLSTFIPTAYHIAIPKKNKIPLTDYPPIQLYYWDKAQYDLGIEEIDKDGIPIAVYDLEKTVCDFLKFRNRVGIDTTKEVLKTYLNMETRNLDKLVKYSKQLKLHSIVNQYLTILL